MLCVDYLSCRQCKIRELTNSVQKVNLSILKDETVCMCLHLNSLTIFSMVYWYCRRISLSNFNEETHSCNNDDIVSQAKIQILKHWMRKACVVRIGLSDYQNDSIDAVIHKHLAIIMNQALHLFLILHYIIMCLLPFILYYSYFWHFPYQIN